MVPPLNSGIPWAQNEAIWTLVSLASASTGLQTFKWDRFPRRVAAIAHSTATKPASKLTNASRNWLVNDWKFVKVSFVFNVEGNSCLSGNPPCCCPCQWPVGVVSVIIFSSYKWWRKYFMCCLWLVYTAYILWSKYCVFRPVSWLFVPNQYCQWPYNLDKI